MAQSILSVEKFFHDAGCTVIKLFQ